MIVLGIEPGTVVTGYGVIQDKGDKISVIEYGALRTSPRSPIGERLSYHYKRLLEIINRCKPDTVAIEQPFVAENARTALAVGKAQAIAILAAAISSIPAHEYTPAQVKQRVANYGASSKEQIQEMVRLQLGLAQIPEPDDAADALAVAICHLHDARWNNRLANTNKE